MAARCSLPGDHSFAWGHYPLIKILRYEERAAERHAFDTMFEDRKTLFVDLLGWDVPVVDDRFEIDAYDCEGSLYVAALDANGAHQGSLRLLPTDRPHLLGEIFPWLCPFGVPRGPNIYEITRLCLPSRLGARTRLEVRNALISAVVDHALGHGIERLTGLVDANFRKEVLTMGWLAEPLGPIMPFGGAMLGAFQLHLAPDTPDRLAWHGIYRPPSETLRFVAAPDGSGMIGIERGVGPGSADVDGNRA